MKFILFIFFVFLFYILTNTSLVIAQEKASYRIAWCGPIMSPEVLQNYQKFTLSIARRTTLVMPTELLSNACQVGKSEIWWFDNESFKNFPWQKLQEHIASGGIFIVEGFSQFPSNLNNLNSDSVGFSWENLSKNGLFYRSFYLLQNIDGCIPDKSKVLMLKKKMNAIAPVGLLVSAHFLSAGKDCFAENEDYKFRSFINIMFAFLTTDYKEDQRQLPEILKRVRHLGLEL